METSLQDGLQDRLDPVESQHRGSPAPHRQVRQFLEPHLRSLPQLPASPIRTDGCSVAWLASDGSLVEPGGNRALAYIAMQRLMDVIGALLIGLLALPVMALTFLVLLVTEGGPVFCQERVGFCGRRFRMYKFRSMTLDADARQHLVSNELDGPAFKNRHDPRVTRIGRVLRMTSIDELPQLWNVLRGDMSLVGPRPLPPHEIAKCAPRQLQRLAVKPGLTCKWQISGRSNIPFDEWIEMDLWYLEHQSVRTDLALLLKTPWCVLTGRGAY